MRKFNVGDIIYYEDSIVYIKKYCRITGIIKSILFNGFEIHGHYCNNINEVDTVPKTTQTKGWMPDDRCFLVKSKSLTHLPDFL